MAEALHYQSLNQVAAKIRSGETSSAALAELMLARIEELNPILNAFITVTSELALRQAAQADEELGQGHDRGPLHGIPVAIKDLIATEGIRTTGGSKLYENWVPDTDATVVTRLKDAGAVILGKTGLHELAYGVTSINKFFGAIGNPWAPDHDPGGSSGGSASAVAAGMAYAAIGTDTGCSIRQPAHCCGIVGFKPTFGVVSKAGVFPLIWTMDHVGPLTRTVEDAAVVLNAIAGYDEDDNYSVAEPQFEPVDLAPRSIGGLKIGIMRKHFFAGHTEVLEVVENAIAEMEALGAEVVELEIPDIDDAVAAIRATYVEATAVYAADLDQTPEAFSEDVRWKLEATKEITGVQYADAQNFRKGFTERVDALMLECDILLTPTATVAAAPIADRPDDYRRRSTQNTGISDFTGQPSISIPCGFTDKGMPVGLMLTGRRFEDESVLQIAQTVEAAVLTTPQHPSI